MDLILQPMGFLHQQIEEIENYPDKSLFFQNPNIFEGWLALARAIQGLESYDVAEEEPEWNKRTGTNVEYLLSLRELHSQYENLYKAYYNQLKHLLDGYSGWLIGDCFSNDGMEAMHEDQYGKEIENVEDTTKYLSELNAKSLKARSDIYNVLSEIYLVLMAIMNRGGQIVIDMKPSDEDIATAVDDDLREWTRSFGDAMFKKMREDLTRHYKEHRTDRYTPELWSEMMDADEDALALAKRQELAGCDDVRQEHWGEDMEKQMDENGRLMQQILSSCRSEELLDLRKTENIQPFIPLLTTNNLELFYEIIVRRSLIQCEMFPELKEQHDAWLNTTKVQSDNIESSLPDETDPNLNYFAPKKHLQELLKQEWFKEVRTNEKYDESWTDSFISNLMTTQWKEVIAQDWAVTGAREKKTQIKGYVIGLLKDNGVLKGSYDSIAEKVVTDGSRSLSKYMSQGKKQQYADWVNSYVNDIKKE